MSCVVNIFSNFQTCSVISIIALEVRCLLFVGLFEIVSWGILVSLGAGSTLLSLGLPCRLGSTLCESLGLLGSALGSGLLGGGSQLLGSWGLLDKLSWCCSWDNCCSFIWNLCNISCGLRGWVPEINRDLLILVPFLVWFLTLKSEKCLTFVGKSARKPVWQKFRPSTIISTNHKICHVLKFQSCFVIGLNTCL